MNLAIFLTEVADILPDEFLPENMLDKLLYALQVSLFGMIIVFLILILLMLVMYAFQFIFYTIPNKKNGNGNTVKEEPIIATTPYETDIIDENNDDELIVVLSAAIDSYLLESENGIKTKYQIKSFKRV